MSIVLTDLTEWQASILDAASAYVSKRIAPDNRFSVHAGGDPRQVRFSWINFDGGAHSDLAIINAFAALTRKGICERVVLGRYVYWTLTAEGAAAVGLSTMA